MSFEISRRSFHQLACATASLALFERPAFAKDENLARFAWTNTGVVSSPTAHALIRTNIAALNGLRIDMKQVNAAPAVNEALLSGSADIGSVSDFTALTPMAAGAPIKVVAQQTTFRSAILATNKTSIKSLEDLRGKTVCGVFGVTAYQNAEDAVQKAGLKPGKDVFFAHMDVAELADSVRSQRIDAFFTWDPWVAFFEQQGFARILSQNLTAANMLVARSDYIKNQPAALKRFLRAHQEALYFCSRNHKLSNDWFRSLDPARGIPAEVIEAASQFNPNWNAPTFDSIKMTVSADRRQKMELLAEWGVRSRLLPQKPDLNLWIDGVAAEAVDAEAISRPFDVTAVKVL